jgi:hypothetical protein
MEGTSMPNDESVFLTETQAAELDIRCQVIEADAGATAAGHAYRRYFGLRRPRDLRPFSHEDALEALFLSDYPSTRQLLLAYRVDVTVKDWRNAVKATNDKAERLLVYFFSRVANRLSHQEALEVLKELEEEEEEEDVT